MRLGAVELYKPLFDCQVKRPIVQPFADQMPLSYAMESDSIILDQTSSARLLTYDLSKITSFAKVDWTSCIKLRNRNQRLCFRCWKDHNRLG
jgi:hypothetical protein